MFFLNIYVFISFLFKCSLLRSLQPTSMVMLPTSGGSRGECEGCIPPHQPSSKMFLMNFSMNLNLFDSTIILTP